MQALAHDWDKWSRLENSSSRLCPADFGYNHSNFFPGAHWVEERLAEEKRIDNTQNQAETFGRTQVLAHGQDKWSRLENSSSSLSPADF
ncbi:hypothetical protein PoB_004262800 [Plakobranchus ocellatus]|uniref:Uncharacterized protein n=1 Tax=Plakobranchus ocellatus TaxID=259542 RepID=A0AAV4BBD4_9GAST|nr:hypothetical protein PoB_004262800 [Plakobranchus ocellatus]